MSADFRELASNKEETIIQLPLKPIRALSKNKLVTCSAKCMTDASSESKYHDDGKCPSLPESTNLKKLFSG